MGGRAFFGFGRLRRGIREMIALAAAEFADDLGVAAAVAQGAHLRNADGVDGLIDLLGSLRLAAEVAFFEGLVGVIQQVGSFTVREAAFGAEAALDIEVARGVFGDALGEGGGHWTYAL